MIHRAVILVAVAAGAVVFAPAASQFAIPPLPLCDAADPPSVVPCVVSVKKNDIAIPYNSAVAGEERAVALTYTDPDGTVWFNFNIYDPEYDADLVLTDRYEMAINTGPVFPAETFARGHNVVITRSRDSGGNNVVTFAQNPVRAADQGCDGAGVCTSNSGRTQAGYLDGWVDNLAYIDDPADRAAMRGFDLASNVDWISSPLELDYLTHSIFLRVANSHFEGLPTAPDTMPFAGFAEFKLPFPMLRRLYDVDDPDSLTPAAFSVTGAGPAATTVVDIDHTVHTVHVQMEGMTFSKRRLRISGDMRPNRPRNLAAVRTSATTGKLRFLRALPRGSLVRSYVARCESAGGHVRTGTNTVSPVRVSGLLPGVRYDCAVRAKSRWGLSYRARDVMPRFP